MIPISLFYCWKKVFTHIDIGLISKNSVKLHYLKKEDFYSHLNIENITDADYRHANRVC